MEANMRRVAGRDARATSPHDLRQINSGDTAAKDYASKPSQLPGPYSALRRTRGDASRRGSIATLADVAPQGIIWFDASLGLTSGWESEAAPVRRYLKMDPLSKPGGRGHTVAAADPGPRLGGLPGFRGPVRRCGAQPWFWGKDRVRLSPRSRSGHGGIRRRGVDACLGGSLCTRRRLHHLRSDEPQCRWLQPDPRGRCGRHPASNARDRQFHGDGGRIHGYGGGS